MRAIDVSDYDDWLKFLGFRVIAFQRFGSYQGEWYAVVQRPNSKIELVKGSYGSCSGCDELEGIQCDVYSQYRYRERSQKENEINAELAKRLQTKEWDEGFDWEEEIAENKHRADWDMDAQEVVKWLLHQYKSVLLEFQED